MSEKNQILSQFVIFQLLENNYALPVVPAAKGAQDVKASGGKIMLSSAPRWQVDSTEACVSS